MSQQLLDDLDSPSENGNHDGRETDGLGYTPPLCTGHQKTCGPSVAFRIGDESQNARIGVADRAVISCHTTTSHKVRRVPDGLTRNSLRFDPQLGKVFAQVMRAEGAGAGVRREVRYLAFAASYCEYMGYIAFLEAQLTPARGLPVICHGIGNRASDSGGAL